MMKPAPKLPFEEFIKWINERLASGDRVFATHDGWFVEYKEQ